MAVAIAIRPPPNTTASQAPNSGELCTGTWTAANRIAAPAAIAVVVIVMSKIDMLDALRPARANAISPNAIKTNVVARSWE